MDDVRLRPLVFEDWPLVHGWAKLPEMSRYQTWGPNTEAQTQSFVRESSALWHSRPQTSYPHAILLDDEVVGIADLHLRGPWAGEIGYGIHPDRWGRGIATAAARELLRMAFTERGRHRVYATCDPRNMASARVLVKIGMTYEGRMRETMRVGDGWRDSDQYAILEQEWRPV
ncbi:GNAT family N-acetyltransferase [Paractinoplanes toevensis]|uniref:N-acetyltransferase n=1 Tax=Paractinoplanes toevensis TaxID=571911 RepID=A0A919TAR9_9ACTN|nr:GNAT family protein [Actinoplanes toevensis]GIM92213.1 N-acetyltransferase [Actinoplanes toevensis]